MRLLGICAFQEDFRRSMTMHREVKLVLDIGKDLNFP